MSRYKVKALRDLSAEAGELHMAVIGYVTPKAAQIKYARMKHPAPHVQAALRRGAVRGRRERGHMSSRACINRFFRRLLCSIQ